MVIAACCLVVGGVEKSHGLTGCESCGVGHFSDGRYEIAGWGRRIRSSDRFAAESMRSKVPAMATSSMVATYAGVMM